VFFLLILFNKKKAGFGWLYARGARQKRCALYTPRSRFVLVNFSYQTLVFRFLEFCLHSSYGGRLRRRPAAADVEGFVAHAPQVAAGGCVAAGFSRRSQNLSSLLSIIVRSKAE